MKNTTNINVIVKVKIRGRYLEVAGDDIRERKDLWFNNLVEKVEYDPEWDFEGEEEWGDKVFKREHLCQLVISLSLAGRRRSALAVKEVKFRLLPRSMVSRMQRWLRNDKN